MIKNLQKRWFRIIICSLSTYIVLSLISSSDSIKYFLSEPVKTWLDILFLSILIIMDFIMYGIPAFIGCIILEKYIIDKFIQYEYNIVDTVIRGAILGAVVGITLLIVMMIFSFLLLDDVTNFNLNLSDLSEYAINGFVIGWLVTCLDIYLLHLAAKHH